MSTSVTTTKSTEGLREDKTNRYQSLVQKKAALEKRLNEKYEQLHQLCQKVSTRAFFPEIHSSMTSLALFFFLVWSLHFFYFFLILGG